MSQATGQQEFQSADHIIPCTRTLEEAWKIQDKIDDLKKKLARLEEEREQIIEEHVNSGVMQEGPFSVKKTVRKRAALDTALFAEKYPAEFQELWQEIGQTKFKPSKTDASKVLTRHQIEKISTVSETVTYDIDFDIHQGAEP